MLLVSIFDDILIAVISTIYCSASYKKQYSGINSINLGVVESYNSIFGRLFPVIKNYANISSNLILKGVLAIICNIVIHLTGKMWISYLYLLVFTASLMTASNRRKAIKAISEDKNVYDIMFPVYKVFRAIPIASVFYILTFFVTYAFRP